MQSKCDGPAVYYKSTSRGGKKWFRSSQSVKSDIFIFPFFLLHFQQIISSDETLWSI